MRSRSPQRSRRPSSHPHEDCDLPTTTKQDGRSMIQGSPGTEIQQLPVSKVFCQHDCLGAGGVRRAPTGSLGVSVLTAERSTWLLGLGSSPPSPSTEERSRAGHATTPPTPCYLPAYSHIVPRLLPLCRSSRSTISLSSLGKIYHSFNYTPLQELTISPSRSSPRNTGQSNRNTRLYCERCTRGTIDTCVYCRNSRIPAGNYLSSF